MSSLKGLAQEYDEEEDPVRRGMVARALVSKILEGPVNDETSVIGVGPVSLDVAMARAHGWGKGQIERVWSALEAASLAEAEIARLRHPELFDDGEDIEIFVGDEHGDVTCSKCGSQFSCHHERLLSSGVYMLLDAAGVHVGFLLFEGGSRLVCFDCGHESVS